ncbi:hypothetical protein O181_072856 [Austropuccinia psidii MF-1]|uniref:Reverse transcriptase Ty1/copia-type domain-containing protein n=1 Tax=Austropuccinia psidii MF-1 TaxID=1389203 RepID=A0A9Q3I7R9_9BASI|nr:hypothetical protein [Austropuccinia psidii MF-1]
MNMLPYPRRADAFLSSVGIIPHYFRFALKSPEKDSWMAEMEREHVSMDNLQVWDVIERQESQKLVGTTWVFRKNINPSNEVTEYKAQFCAEEVTQTQGIDFENTYVPTGPPNSS